MGAGGWSEGRTEGWRGVRVEARFVNAVGGWFHERLTVRGHGGWCGAC
jgi:hypothetical protein